RFAVPQGIDHVVTQTGSSAQGGMGVPDVRAVGGTGRGQHGQLAHFLGQGGLVTHVLEQGYGPASHLWAIFQHRHRSSADATRARAHGIEDVPQVLTHTVTSYQGYAGHRVLLTYEPGADIQAGCRVALSHHTAGYSPGQEGSQAQPEPPSAKACNASGDMLQSSHRLYPEHCGHAQALARRTRVIPL